MFPRVPLILSICFFAVIVAALPKGTSDVTSTSTSTSITNAPVENKCAYTGGSQCCQSVDVPGPDEFQALLAIATVPIEANTLVGHGCSPLVGIDATCNAQAVCCEDTYGAIYIGCNNIIL